MRVARLWAAGDVRVTDEPELLAPQPGHSTVQVRSVGLCGSDLHWYSDGGIGETRIGTPIVPGHEFAGVALDGPHAGRRVAVDPAIPCRRCELCRAGHGNLCPTVRFAGHGSLDGGLRERLHWPDHLLVPLPDHLSDDAGALLEPLGVAIHAVGLGHLRPGQDVLIAGAGPIGILCAYVARRGGARRVYVSEPLTHRRETARRFAADATFVPEHAPLTIADLTGDRGVDLVVEMAGIDAAIATAVECVRPGGRIVLGGIPTDDRSTFPASAARRKGVTFAMVRRMHNTYPRALALCAEGALELNALVTARFDLDGSSLAFQTASDRTGNKVIIDVSS